METLLTYFAVPFCTPFFLRCGITGKDLHKRDKPLLPEAMGLVAGVILLLFIQPSPIWWCTLVGLWIGALDDVIDLRWRYKLIMSAIAYIPIYLTTDLATAGPFYHVYMLLWCVWCGNAINIHAGINGLEVGQSVVIALGLLPIVDETSVLTSYICVAFGLLVYNWYPASVFVGDSWCYMSGMFFVAIAQHETESLAIIMIPQIINTLLSVPELIGDCPRHRMPNYDAEKDCLVASGRGTLMNVILHLTGPMHEKTLAIVLLGVQFLCVLVAYQYKS
jgi:UDP-N-acetylglucosamine--dolichyl-phosphate N-acetylglucosaminephosphotransferase|tara:strand:- start:2200 stop:3030 length:831 start_codon:yes stop_codon:yes gene_type:complete